MRQVGVLPIAWRLWPSTITKAVIPAAGLGTRFLPATKAMPKEMLPVVDKPAIQYVVEEAVAAGLHDVLMITGRNKNALENHFDRVGELEETLARRATPRSSRRSTTRPTSPTCTTCARATRSASATRCCAPRCTSGSEPFAVLLGDDIIDERDLLLTRMLEVQAQRNATVVALLEVDPRIAHLYGVATVEPTDDDDVVRVTGLVEKPAPGTAPSNLAIIGRYVLRPEVFDVLENTPPGKGGEIQLTDALQALARGPEHGPAACTASSSAAVATTPATASTTSRRSCSSRVDRDDLGPELRAVARSTSPSNAGLRRWTTTIPDPAATGQVDASGRSGCAMRARSSASCCDNRGWLRKWEATNPHGPMSFDTRASIRSLCSRTRAAGTGCRSSIEYDGEFAGPAQRVVDHLRLAVVGDDRLLGGRAVRGQGRHPDRGRARHRLLLLRARAAPHGDLHPARERAEPAGGREARASATRGCGAGTSTSTATGATTSASRSPSRSCRRACCGAGSTDGCRAEVGDGPGVRTAPPPLHPLRLG